MFARVGCLFFDWAVVKTTIWFSSKPAYCLSAVARAFASLVGPRRVVMLSSSYLSIPIINAHRFGRGGNDWIGSGWAIRRVSPVLGGLSVLSETDVICGTEALSCSRANIISGFSKVVRSAPD